MDYITPSDRHRVIFGSLDELIAPDQPVRFPDAFAEKSELARLSLKGKDTTLERSYVLFSLRKV